MPKSNNNVLDFCLEIQCMTRLLVPKIKSMSLFKFHQKCQTVVCDAGWDGWWYAETFVPIHSVTKSQKTFNSYHILPMPY